MTYTNSQCIGKCSFCPQANGTNKKYSDNLSRVQWPVFDWDNFYNNLEENQKPNNGLRFKRVCIQVLNYRGFFDDVLYIIDKIHTKFPDLNISTAIPPVSSPKMEKMHNAGLERIGIALDACKPSLFAKIKGPDNQGPYSWKNHWKTMDEALVVFGNGKVTTHFIVGLGETEEEMISSIHNAIERNILPGIFLFTPIKGTPMALEKRPPIESFRRIQLCRFLLLKNLQELSRFTFKEGVLVQINKFSQEELRSLINEEIPFLTAGCPDCNRPNYTYRPGEEASGFPRSLTFEEKEMVYNELKSLVSI